MRKVQRVAAVLVCFFLIQALVGAQSATDTVYVTNTGAKYHRSGCSSLRHSAIPMTLKDAATRYQPCKICRPPVLGTATSTTPAAANSNSPKAAPVQRAIEVGRCQAITKKGAQCSRTAKLGTKYCWQHGG
jgi:hypothetical protein